MESNVATQNVPAVTAEVIKKTLNELMVRLPDDRKVSWLQLCEAKSQVMDKLSKKELELQSFLLGFEKMDLLTLQTKLAEYVKGLKDMPEIRKGFTRYLDKIADELMLPEKRAAAWETLTKANALFLQLRIQKEQEDNKVQLKKNEADQFTAHVKNEYVKIFSEYKLALHKTITDAYAYALDAAEYTDEGLEHAIQTTISCLKDIKPKDPAKFNYQLNSKEEIIALYQAIPLPDFKLELEGAILGVRDRFSTYRNDKANAGQAKKFLETEQKQFTENVNQEATQTVAVNNLLATSSTTQIQENTGVKAVKRKTVIVTDDTLTSEAAMKIVSAFLANWGKCLPFLRVKGLANLKISQMATALDDAEIKVEGVLYKEEIK